MFLRPSVLLSAASRAAQRPAMMTRMVAPSAIRMYASLPRDDVQSRVLNVVKGFDKVDVSKVNSFVYIVLYMTLNEEYRLHLKPALLRILVWTVWIQ